MKDEHTFNAQGLIDKTVRDMGDIVARSVEEKVKEKLVNAGWLPPEEHQELKKRIAELVSQ